jgi:hypothetical protein
MPAMERWAQTHYKAFLRTVLAAAQPSICSVISSDKLLASTVAIIQNLHPEFVLHFWKQGNNLHKILMPLHVNPNHPLPQSNNTKNDLWLLREGNLPTQFYVKGTACLWSPGICNYKVAKPKRFHEILATSLMCLYGEGSKQGNISTYCNVFSGQGASQ